MAVDFALEETYLCAKSYAIYVNQARDFRKQEFSNIENLLNPLLATN